MPGSGIPGMVKGNEIEDEPRCEADADGRHRYRDVSRREDRGMLCVTEQCHECRMVRETACGRDEAVVRRRFYDPGRRVPVSKRPGDPAGRNLWNATDIRRGHEMDGTVARMAPSRQA